MPDPKHHLSVAPKLYPVLAAFHASPRTWEVYCPCGVWHTHGPGNGHRVAHCDHSRPGALNGLGYILSDDHPSADIVQRRARPKLEPLAWRDLG